MINITFLNYWVCPLDTTITDPVIGKISEEDWENGYYLLERYTLAADQEGFMLLDISDMKEYRIFKGKTEAQAYIVANWP